jgi:phage host-nuclease inhibitor protein Gam
MDFLIKLLNEMKLNGGIPAIEFKGSTFSDLADRLQGEGVYVAKEEDLVSSTVNYVSDRMRDPESLFYKEIDQIADKLADKLNNLKHDVASLTSVVQAYVEEIDQLANEGLNKNPVYAEQEDIELIENFVDFDWKEIRLVGTVEDIFGYFTERYNTGTDVLSMTTISNLNNKLPLHHPQSTPIKDMGLDNELRDSLVSYYQELMGDKVTSENIRGALNIITKADMLKRACNACLYQSNFNKTEQLFDYVENLNKYYKLVDVMSRDSSTHLNESIAETFLVQAKIFKEYLMLCAATMQAMRVSLYKNMITIGSTHVNMDNWEEYKSEGGDKTDLAKRIYIYNRVNMDNKVLDVGFTVENIIRMKDNINKQISEIATKSNMRKENIRNETYMSMFRKVMRKHVDEFNTTLNDDYINKIIIERSKQFVEDIALEDSVRATIMQLSYKDTMFGVFYDRLGKAMTVLASEKSDIVQDDLVDAENSVVISLLTDYIAKYYKNTK